MGNKNVVTRFAPSPTGSLHLGGARTALFNYLHARNNNGRFILRIEDTDKGRSKQEHVDQIKESLEWLGIEWDQETYQSKNKNRHLELIKPLDNGSLIEYTKPSFYRENDALRLDAKAWATSIEYIEVKDLVQGNIRVGVSTIDNFVVQKSNGDPIYMMANLIDDIDEGVTVVIRGDDHLTNTFRQQLLATAMGIHCPFTYAHIPLIHGPDGAKLSKRHGATSVLEYRDMGYLPEAVLSMLLQLGWSHDGSDILDMALAREHFDIVNVNKGASRLDFKRLTFLNRHHIKQMPCPYTNLAEMRLWPAIRERASTFIEAKEMMKFLHQSPKDYDQGAVRKLKNVASATSHQNRLCEKFKEMFIDGEGGWDIPTIERVVRQYCDTHKLKLGEIAGSLRLALTGVGISPPIFDILYALGILETLKRCASFSKHMESKG